MSDEVVKPAEKKSWVAQFVEKASGAVEKAPPATPLSYVKAGGSVLGEVTTGVATGALLGAAHAKFGLDINGWPADGIIAGAAAAAAIATSVSMPQVSTMAQRVSGQAGAVFAFRKAYGLVKGAPLPAAPVSGVTRIAAPGTGPGISGEDPIVKAAEGLPG